VAPVLLDLGGTAVLEVEGALVTHIPSPDDPEGLARACRDALGRLSPQIPVEVEWRWRPHEDWSHLWKRGLGVREITPNLFVAPSWETFSPDPGQILITLDPGMAFGTAEHATTRGCLRALAGRDLSRARLVDVGAGSGILSIAAARMGARDVLALEMDEASCETAEANLVRNGVEGLVRVLRTRVEGPGPLPEAPFQGVMANLQSRILTSLLPSFASSLEPGGWLIMSGVLREEKDEVLTAAAESGWRFLQAEVEDGWWTGVLTLPGPDG
jgi:ribosomal protein L11 methyltransferase